MKAFNLLFGIIFTVSSVYGQQTVTIEGDIQNMPDSLTIGCREMKGESMQLYTDDLFSMVNGKFKITKEVSQTTRMFLHINNTGYEFWVKPGANIKIPLKNPFPPKTAGSAYPITAIPTTKTMSNPAVENLIFFNSSTAAAAISPPKRMPKSICFTMRSPICPPLALPCAIAINVTVSIYAHGSLLPLSTSRREAVL